MRKLASVQKIIAINLIPEADAIECASILGWKVVVKKGQFKVGDSVVYAEIDSILPPKPEFEFLAPYKYRIKTLRLRGQLSQGIAFPMSVLPPSTCADGAYADGIYAEGDDVTEILGVVKYELPVPIEMQGQIAQGWPSYIPHTDEPRVQSWPAVLEDLRGQTVYVTTKVDGTSATYVHSHVNLELTEPGEFMVCSRTQVYKESGCVYWLMAKKHDIETKLRAAGDYAVQGEIAGPKIQANRYGLKELQLFVFNVYDIKEGRYLDYADFIAFCKQWDLPTVPIVTDTLVLNHTVDELLEMARGTYPNGFPREGIVIRAIKDANALTMRNRASFKVVNNDFLLKLKE